MRVLIASNDEAKGRRIADALEAGGLEDACLQVVGLDVAADRASRLVPRLVVVVMPADVDAGLVSLRETRHTMAHGHFLVLGPTSDAKAILRTLHEGADEYLDESQLDEEIAGALVRFKAKRDLPAETQEAGRVIAVLSPSGGCGGSTLAVNLSTLLAQRKGRCALIDLRLFAGDLASMLDLRPVHSIAEMGDRLDRIDQSMFEQFLVRHPCGISLLAPPAVFDEVDKVSDKAVRRALAMARVRFPYVVVDVDNAISPEQVEALWQSDVIVMVLRLDYRSIRNARRTMDNLVQLGIGLERVQLVVNNYGESRQLRVKQAEDALGRPITWFVPHDPGRVNDAVNHGVPVVLYKPYAKVSRRLRELAESINGTG